METVASVKLAASQVMVNEHPRLNTWKKNMEPPKMVVCRCVSWSNCFFFWFRLVVGGKCHHISDFAFSWIMMIDFLLDSNNKHFYKLCIFPGTSSTFERQDGPPKSCIKVVEKTQSLMKAVVLRSVLMENLPRWTRWRRISLTVGWLVGWLVGKLSWIGGIPQKYCGWNLSFPELETWNE